MKRAKIFAILLAAFLACAPKADAQKAAIKTNLIYDALANINLGAEFKMAPKWTIDVNGNINCWNISGYKKWKHWMLQPEVRYWLCEAMHGNFVGLELHGGQYNIGHVNTDFSFLGTNFAVLKDQRYQGWYGGAGVTFGHAWILADHWNIEAEIGLGWSYTCFDSFPCAKCGNKLIDNGTHNYFGITKAALNVVYIF